MSAESTPERPATPERRITREVVQHVAHLARLKLSNAELILFTSQLGDVLESASAIEALDTEGVEPTSHPFLLENVFREDEPKPALALRSEEVLSGEVFSEEVLSEAPRREEGQFRVPPVLLRGERSVPPRGERNGE